MSDEERVTCRYRLHGRVQGVGFRWWTARTARAAGLRGTVRNLPDGGVEVVVAGGAEAVGRFRGQLERGPPGAEVRQIRDLPASTDELPDAFEIVR